MPIIAHPLYGRIPYLYITQTDIPKDMQDMKFETLLERLKNCERLFEKPDCWEIDFFIDKFLISKKNAYEILKAFQEGLYKGKNSSNYKVQEDYGKTERHISDFANKVICLEKAYSDSIFRIRSSTRDRLTLEKANFLREAFEELVKEETNSYIKTTNNIYKMLPVWLG